MPTTTQRGYGSRHQAERRRFKRLVDAGEATCCRCERAILPEQAWHLDHNDDRTEYLGVSHAWCNLSAAGKKARRGDRRRQLRPVSRDWLGDAQLIDGRLYRPVTA